MRIYVDGKRMILARTRSTGGTINESDFPLSGTVSGSVEQAVATSADVIAMPGLTSPRLLMGSDRSLAGAQVAHDISLTRVFTRALSDSEIFQNFIGTIPSNATISNFKIG